jgi:hypothetical protein
MENFTFGYGETGESVNLVSYGAMQKEQSWVHSAMTALCECLPTSPETTTPKQAVFQIS